MSIFSLKVRYDLQVTDIHCYYTKHSQSINPLTVNMCLFTSRTAEFTRRTAEADKDKCTNWGSRCVKQKQLI